MSINLRNVCNNFLNGNTIAIRNFVNLDSLGKIWSRPKFDVVNALIDNDTGIRSLLYTEGDHIIKQIDANRIVLAYITFNSGTYYINVRVGLVNQIGQISWGTISQTHSTSSNISKLKEIIVLSNTNIAKILIRTASLSGSDYCNCQVVEINGTTVSNSGILTNLNFPATQTVGVAITENCVLLANGMSSMFAYQLSINGYTVSLTTSAMIQGANYTSVYRNFICRIDNNRALLVYNLTEQNTGTQEYNAIVIKTNYTNISLGGIENISTSLNPIADIGCCILNPNFNSNKACVFFGSSLSSVVLDINDTTITKNTINSISNDIGNKMQVLAINNNSCILYNYESIYTFQIQNNNLVLLDTIPISINSYSYYGVCIFALQNGRYLIVNGRGSSVLIQKSKIIGVSQDLSGGVILKGIVTGFSGLIANSNYYTDGYELYANNPYNTYTFVGKALSSTDLFIDDFIPAKNLTNL